MARRFCFCIDLYCREKYIYTLMTCNSAPESLTCKLAPVARNILAFTTAANLHVTYPVGDIYAEMSSVPGVYTVKLCPGYICSLPPDVQCRMAPDFCVMWRPVYITRYSGTPIIAV